MSAPAGTTVDDVKAALVALAETTFAADAAPVSVIYGPRTATTVTEDRLVSVQGIGPGQGTRTADSLAGDGAAETASEAYVLTVVCSADLQGAGDETQQAATQGALDLWTRLTAAVRAVPGRDLGLAAVGVQLAVPDSGFELAERADENGRQAAVRWGLRVMAQCS